MIGIQGLRPKPAFLTFLVNGSVVRAIVGKSLFKNLSTYVMFLGY